MGLIGIRIRIAHKEKYTPEFSLTGNAPSTRAPESPVADQENPDATKTESEHITEEEVKIAKVVTMEEEESELK